MSSDDAQAQAQACVPDELKHASAHDPDTFEYGDRPASSVFARDGAPVHNVPMAVIRRPLPSELDEAKVAAFMEEMQVRPADSRWLACWLARWLRYRALRYRAPAAPAVRAVEAVEAAWRAAQLPRPAVRWRSVRWQFGSVARWRSSVPPPAA